MLRLQPSSEARLLQAAVGSGAGPCGNLHRRVRLGELRMVEPVVWLDGELRKVERSVAVYKSRAGLLFHDWKGGRFLR